MRQRFRWFLGIVARRPAVAVIVVVALALGGGVLALRLQPSAGADTFVSRSSPTFKADRQDHRYFGQDAVIVLVREPLTDLVQTTDLAQLSALEACLSGHVLVKNQSLIAFTAAPPGATPYGGWNSPCGKLSRARA